MALYYPDILEHNNPSKPLMDDGQLAGSLQVVADVAARNAIPLDKRKIGSVVSWIQTDGTNTIQKFIGTVVTDAEWALDIYWQELVYPYLQGNLLELLTADATSEIILGDKDEFLTFLIRYQMIRDTIVAMGYIQVMQNRITLETPVYFTYRELGGSLGLVGITSAYDGNNVVINVQIDNSSITDVTMVYDIEKKPFIYVPLWAALSMYGVSGPLYSTFFLDANNGWTVGDYNGITLYTSDGGTTWIPQTPASGVTSLFSVHFPTALVGYAVGNGSGGTIFISKTTNGGTTWVRQTSPVSSGIMKSVYFVDTLHGWAVGKDGSNNIVILATTDGGANWVQQTSPVSVQVLNGVHFVDALHGWAVGYDNSTFGTMVILATTDGGANWVQQSSPVTSGELKSVFFINTLVGWAVGVSGSYNKILATTDGGTTWVEQTSPVLSGILYSVNFIDALNGWAVGDNFSTGIIMATTDGGATWEQQACPATTLNLYSVSMLGAQLGYAAGQDNTSLILALKYS